MPSIMLHSLVMCGREALDAAIARSARGERVAVIGAASASRSALFLVSGNSRPACV